MLENLKNELTIRGFSPRTAENYLYYNQDILMHAGKEPEAITQEDIKAYLAHLINERKLKPRSCNLAISSLKFHYDGLLGRNLLARINTLRPEQKQPDLLSTAEIEALYKAAGSNLKHRIAVGMFVGSGPRASESAQLRFEDIDFKEGLATIRKGKGAKQRTAILSKRVLADIKAYQLQRPNDTNPFIFKSYTAAGHLSRQRLWSIIKECAKKAGITKRTYPHALRASFATNLLEKGYDMGLVQELLGHESANTTRIYAKYSKERIKKVKSPF